LIFLIILIPIIFLTYIFSVQSYQITDEKLIIKRPISSLNKEILFSEIGSVQLLNKNDFSGTIRTGGVGGLFGSYGYFSNKKLGSFTMYATNNKNRVLLIVGKSKAKIVLSPDDLEMADDLQSHLKRRDKSQ
jgi:Bacterial PH domain